jgi:hypothetical protein
MMTTQVDSPVEGRQRDVEQLLAFYDYPAEHGCT